MTNNSIGIPISTHFPSWKDGNFLLTEDYLLKRMNRYILKGEYQLAIMDMGKRMSAIKHPYLQSPYGSVLTRF